MLTRNAGLSAADLDAIADLERRTVAADGGRLKLEWGTLAHRPGDRVDDLLWWDGALLTGFLGLYGFGGGMELAGMVDPAARRHGIGTALVDAALELAAERGNAHALLVCPGSTGTGAAFAAQRGAVPDHSEHVLSLDGDPILGPHDASTVLRPATQADATDVARLLAAGFGPQHGDIRAELAASDAQNLVVQRCAAVIGYLRLTLDQGTGGVYGFVVDPAWRGRGIGRDVLGRCCASLREQGAHRVGLEVEVDNEQALGLYTSLGFHRRSTENYFSLPTGA